MENIVQKQKKIEDFKFLITEEIDSEELALYLRRFKNESVNMFLNVDEGNNSHNREWICDGIYWLDKISEILDPYLSKDLLTAEE